MNREMRRLMEREERRQKNQEKGARRTPGAVARQQTGERKPLWQRIRSYFHEVRQELRRVSWPTRDQMIAFSTVTIITTVALTAVVFGFDVVMKEIVLFVVQRS
ncbi:MAG TPA: preprotein translocase subunit SecE [Acidimicrobiia bacterium]|jgi:preprotein translocase subunit SecE|nr:preprotein translocase subunit SecE [Acidimicrobiia bacterium]